MRRPILALFLLMGVFVGYGSAAFSLAHHVLDGVGCDQASWHHGGHDRHDAAAPSEASPE